MATRFYVYCALSLLFIALTFPFETKSQTHPLKSIGNQVNTLPNKIVIKLKPKYAQAGVNRQRQATNTVNPLNQVLSQIKPISYKQKFPRAATYPNLKPGQVDLTLLYEITFDNQQYTLPQLRQLFLGTGLVEYVEPLYTPEILHQPNDPLADSILAKQYHLKQSQIYKAWDIEKGDSTIVIGILDTGTRLSHEDLGKNCKRNYADRIDGLDNDNDGFIDNFEGWDTADDDNLVNGASHGTLVTGVAAGTTNNKIGIAGVAYQCRFLPVKVFSSVANGSFGGYEGIVYAADHGCHVINLSWGGENPYSQFEQDIINYAAINKNVVIVAAAGNTPKEVYIYPASYDNVIAVTAIDKNNVRGSSQTYNYKVDLMAAGVLVTTTNSGANNAYAEASGSSLASPIVAGTAALLRKKFPEYTALQIAERLRVTADNTYGSGNNKNFLEKMGFGRLNAYRALTAAQPKAVRNTGNNYDQHQAFAGNTLSITGNFQNILSPVTNLTISLSSPSPFVSIVRSTFAAGGMSPLSTTNNLQQPFQVIISENIPLNQPVVFRYGYSDGEYTDYQYFTLILNPEYLNIEIGDLDATITSRGKFGYNNYSPIQGIGAIYKNVNPLLSEGGLMIGTSATNVSDNVRSTPGKFNQTFTFINPIRFANAGKRADQEAYGSFKDAYPETGSVGVTVKQRAFAWQQPSLNQTIILEYAITNTTPNPLTNLHAGLFADWDIGNYSNNTAAWDSVTRTGYTYQTDKRNLFAGVTLLTPEPATTYALSSAPATSASINIMDGISSAEKFNALSNTHRQNRQAGGINQDVMQVVGSALNRLEPGKSITIAFALVASESLTDMQTAAGAALIQYKKLKTGAAVIARTDSVCTGESAVIKPEGGTLFNFYADPEQKQLLKTGNSYTTNPITAATTYYISNVDSLYESPITPTTIYPTTTSLDFTNSPRPTNLSDGNNVVFTSQAPGAQQWFWDLGNGQQSTTPNPITRFDTPGTYQVKLKIITRQGCTDSLTKSVTFSRSPAPIVNNDSTCYNTAYAIQPEGGNLFNFYGDAAGKNILSSGNSFTTPPLTQNTTYYVSNIDGYFESELVPVIINVTHLEADFSWSPDPVTAGAKGLITFKDQTQNAVKWQWDFDNGTNSQEKNPVIQFTKPGTYMVSLTVTDKYGCTQTIQKSLEIKYIDYIHEWSENEINIFPVPTKKILNIKISEAINASQGITITILTAIGKVALQTTIYQTGKIELDLSALAGGIYFIRINNDNNFIIRRIERLR